METASIILLVVTILLIILYTYDRIKSMGTTTREFTLNETQENIQRVVVLVKKNDVSELYLIDDNNFCTKVNF